MHLSKVVAHIAMGVCFIVGGATRAVADEAPVFPAENASEAVSADVSLDATESPASAPSPEAAPKVSDVAGGEARQEAPSEAARPSAEQASPKAGEAAVSAVVEPAKKSSNPWAGTTVSYEHVFSAVSLDKSAEQTWNPYYAHSISLQPKWRFHDYVGLNLRVDVEQELTDSDDTVRRHEWMWSDLNLEVTAGKGFTEKVTGININGSLRFGIPTSKVSQARTMILSLAPGLSVSRKFPVLSGLTVAYSGRFAYQFHQSTTAQYDGTSLACGDPDSIDCERFTNTGLRNSETVLTHGPSVSIQFIDQLSFSMSYTLLRNGLYDLDPYEVKDAASGIHLTTLEAGENDISARHGQAFNAELSYQPVDVVGISLGVLSAYADLRPNGTYQTPFFNRFTNVYLNLSLDIDAIVVRAGR